MKKTKVSVITPVLLMSAAVLPLHNAYAENSSVYEHFNENDVNGTITVKIPEDTTANIKITFTSPEVTDEPYYIVNLNGGKTQSFDIEGRDNTTDDYRNYTLNASITDNSNNTITYVDTFTVPDGNDNPDSFINLEYIFSVDYSDSSDSWKISSETETQKNITLYFNANNLGDINSDGIIDAVDASLVLNEYALISTEEKTTFTENQNISADVNKDGIIDAVDASKILNYYAESSTDGNPSWEENTNVSTTIPTSTTSNTVTTTTVTTAVPSDIDYSSYMESIRILQTQADIMEFHNYYIYDINNDGIYELITEMGINSEDNKYSIYTMKNNEMTFICDIDAVNSTLIQKDNQIYIDYTSSEKQVIKQIIFDGENISTKDINEDISEISQKITKYDWSDLSGIPHTNTTTTTSTTTIPIQKLDEAMKNAIPDEVSNPEYCYYDVNNDNIPELFIKAEYLSGTRINMLVYENGEFTGTDVMGETAFVYPEKNLIKIISNEGAIATFVYKISENNSIELIDKLVSYIDQYYYNDSQITKEEYNNKLAEYESLSWAELTYTKIPLYENFPYIENAPENMIFYTTFLNGTVTTDSGGLNLRTGAGTNYDIIQEIPQNDNIYILGTGNNWYYILYNGKYGYVSADFVTINYQI